jgi:CDP-diglyceride synthetase
MPPRRRKAAAAAEDGAAAGAAAAGGAGAAKGDDDAPTKATATSAAAATTATTLLARAGSVTTRTPRPSPPPPLPPAAAAAAAAAARFRSFRVRTASTVAMIVGFFAFVWAGHVPCALLVLMLQYLMVRELFGMARAAAKEERLLPGFRRQQWYFFAVAGFYLYGRFIHNNLLLELALPSSAAQDAAAQQDAEDDDLAAAAAKTAAAAAAVVPGPPGSGGAALRHASASRGSVPLTALLPPRFRAPAAALGAAALRHHAMSAFALYMAGFVAFVLSLRRGHYAYQFQQYAWTHMILLVVFLPSSFFVSNIFEGLVWFLLPSSLIIVNDIAAYLAGFFCGRTPLIALSPKKTWEGFIGGFLGTVVAAFFLARAFSGFKWMTCPRPDLSLGPLDCDPGPLFEARDFTPAELAAWLRVPPAVSRLARHLASLALGGSGERVDELAQGLVVRLEPIQLHAVILAVFASAVAPFGGFFASGFKRAFKMKDFGDTIPGHGGVTDRFDCQTIMAAFAYLYYWHFVDGGAGRLGRALTAAQALRDTDRLELFGRLGALLVAEGLLPESAGLPVAQLALRLANATIAGGG